MIGSSIRPVVPDSYDIDLLARMSNEVAVLEGVLREACVAAVNPDGLAFDAKSVRGETIVEEADYPGVRVTFR
jgi:hypothetical protein